MLDFEDMASETETEVGNQTAEIRQTFNHTESSTQNCLYCGKNKTCSEECSGMALQTCQGKLKSYFRQLSDTTAKACWRENNRHNCDGCTIDFESVTESLKTEKAFCNASRQNWWLKLFGVVSFVSFLVILGCFLLGKTKEKVCNSCCS